MGNARGRAKVLGTLGTRPLTLADVERLLPPYVYGYEPCAACGSAANRREPVRMADGVMMLCRSYAVCRWRQAPEVQVRAA